MGHLRSKQPFFLFTIKSLILRISKYSLGMNAQCWLKYGSVVMLEDVLILWWFWPTSRGCTTLHTRDERPDTLPPVCQPQVLTNTDSHVNNESKASILNPVEFWTLRATFFKVWCIIFYPRLYFYNAPWRPGNSRKHSKHIFDNIFFNFWIH